MERKSKLILLFLLIIISISCTFNDKKKTYKISYKGIIVKNYQDDNNHGMLTFDVLNNNYTFSVTSVKWPRSWEYAEIGDSIIKPPDTLILIIKKPDGSEKHFNYDW